MKTTHLILGLIALLLLGGGLYVITNPADTTVINPEPDITTETMPVEPDGGIGDGAEPLPPFETPTVEENDQTSNLTETVIGQSVNDADIIAYHYGAGANEILLIGGVHGSYAPNTRTVTEELRTFLTENEEVIPDNHRVTIIPALNPDGLAETDPIAGRFNTNGVDLNRNFGCDWAPTSQWREREVSGGDAPYSEPEAAALRRYTEEANVVAAVTWFAAEGRVYPAACGGNPSEEATALAETFADAAGYPVSESFDAYQINGDLTNWLASEGIPTISVLLTDRINSEVSQNEAGLKALLASLASE